MRIDRRIDHPSWMELILKKSESFSAPLIEDGCRNGTTGTTGTIYLYNYEKFVGLYLPHLCYTKKGSPFPIDINDTIPILMSEGRYDPVWDCYRRQNFVAEDLGKTICIVLESSNSRERHITIRFNEEAVCKRFGQNLLGRVFKWPVKSRRMLMEDIWNHLVSKRCIRSIVDEEANNCRINHDEILTFLETFFLHIRDEND
mmetsp:Transcript_44311/g.107097  ORF Transcript_44311/g.107097 Transcript_44311/m.107097 type:complete len:201 (+) Transcript_44311:132-734(+)